MRRLALLSFLSISHFGVACGASSEVVDEGSGAVQGGARDTVHTYAVGLRTGTSVCSGTLVAPNLVLTARSCVAQAPVNATSCQTARFGATLPVAGMTITTEPSVVAPKKLHAVSEILVPRDDAACGADIALLVLTDNVAREEAITAAPLVHPFPVSRAVAVIGYGATSATATDLGKRRVREDVRVTCMPGDFSFTCLLRASDREFSTEGGVCAGDTGSGAFEQERFGRGEALVTGVLSRRFSLSDECSDATYTRTESHAAFLLASAKAAATKGKYTLPVWAGGPADAGAPDGSADASADASSDAASDAAAKTSDAAADATADVVVPPSSDASTSAPDASPSDPKEPTYTPSQSTTPDDLDDRAKKSGADRDEGEDEDSPTSRGGGSTASSGCGLTARSPEAGGIFGLTLLAAALASLRAARRRRT